MYPVTPNEKLRAFERTRASASSLIHDGVISRNEFIIIIDRAKEAFRDPARLVDEIYEREKCSTDHQNGEPLT